MGSALPRSGQKQARHGAGQHQYPGQVAQVVKRGRPAGLKTIRFYNALGTHTPEGYVFEAQSHEDVRTMDDRLLERGGIRHPSGVDLTTMFQQQGIKIG
jgi:hypothetical protein